MRRGITRPGAFSVSGLASSSTAETTSQGQYLPRQVAALDAPEQVEPAEAHAVAVAQEQPLRAWTEQGQEQSHGEPHALKRP